MKKQGKKLHCPKCAKLRNTAVFIQVEHPEEENKPPEVLPVPLGILYKMINDMPALPLESLQKGFFASVCPICKTNTLYKVNKKRQLVMA